MIRRVSPPSLFPRMSKIFFEPSIRNCPFCGAGLKVEKTRTKTVVTLHIGAFKAHETMLSCPNCDSDASYGSEELRKLKPFRGTFGYDILVYAGKAMFLRCRNEEEIKQELAQKHIKISEREITYLA